MDMGKLQIFNQCLACQNDKLSSDMFDWKEYEQTLGSRLGQSAKGVAGMAIGSLLKIPLLQSLGAGTLAASGLPVLVDGTSLPGKAYNTAAKNRAATGAVLGLARAGASHGILNKYYKLGTGGLKGRLPLTTQLIGFNPSTAEAITRGHFMSMAQRGSKLAQNAAEQMKANEDIAFFIKNAGFA